MSNSDKNEGYPFKLIHEEVSQDDTFKYGTHEKVANAMHKLISREDQSATIGLEGSWGSGKSTVVNLLAQKLKTSETLVFTFDAWAHEGDPLRRIFLESLIDTIQALTNEDKKWFDEKSSVIQQRRKTTHIRTRHHTTKYATWLSVSALLVPAGAAFLSQVKYDQLSLFNFTKPFYWLFAIGMIFTMMPLFVTGFWKIGCKLKWKWIDKEEGLSLVNSNSNKETTQDITEDSERTSIEFEQDFKEITEKVFNLQSFERIVIIIDNLDRVEKEDALSIWSTLQTFFQYRNSNSNIEDWRKKIWFIVPYDRDGLSEIWATESTLIQMIENSKAENPKEPNGKRVIHSFLNKCFQVRFEVPVPVMSSWQQFVEENVHIALASWPEDERKSVIRTYQLCNSSLAHSPTPREIRNFINQVGIIGSTWGGKVSAESIALYSHLRYKQGQAELRKKLLDGTALDSIHMQREIDDVIAELAGLLFGVDKDTGMELLLTTPIHSALKKGDKDEIEKLYNRFGEAFTIAWHAQKQIFKPSDEQEYLISYSKAFISLAQINEFKDDLFSLEECWKKETTEKWDLEKYDYADIFDKIIQIFSSSFLEWVFDQARFHVDTTVSEFITNDNTMSHNTVIQINELNHLLKRLDCPLEQQIYDGMTTEKWVTFTEPLALDTLPNWILPSNEVLSNLANSIRPNQNLMPQVNSHCLKLTYNLCPDYEAWTLIAKNLSNWLIYPQRANSDDLYALTFELATDQRDTVATPILNAVTYQYFWSSPHVQTSNGPLAIYIPTLALLAYKNELHKTSYVRHSTKDFWKQSKLTENHHKAFELLLGKQRQKILWSAMRERGNIAITELICTNINNNTIWDIEPSLPLKLFNIDHFNINKDSSIKKIASEFLNRFTVEEISATTNKLELGYAFWNLLQLQSDAALALVNKICGSLTSKDWTNLFNDNNNYFIEIAIANGVDFPRHHFSESFIEFLESQFTKKCDENLWIWENFNSIFSKVQEPKKKATRLVKSYIACPTDIIPLKVFGIIKNLDVSKPEVVLENGVLSKISLWLDNQDAEKIRWVLDKLDLNLPENTLAEESFISRLKKAKDDQDDKCHELVEGLAEKLGIDLKPVKPKVI